MMMPPHHAPVAANTASVSKGTGGRSDCQWSIADRKLSPVTFGKRVVTSMDSKRNPQATRSGPVVPPSPQVQASAPPRSLQSPQLAPSSQASPTALPRNLQSPRVAASSQSPPTAPRNLQSPRAAPPSQSPPTAQRNLQSPRVAPSSPPTAARNLQSPRTAASSQSPPTAPRNLQSLRAAPSSQASPTAPPRDLQSPWVAPSSQSQPTALPRNLQSTRLASLSQASLTAPRRNLQSPQIAPSPQASPAAQHRDLKSPPLKLRALLKQQSPTRLASASTRMLSAASVTIPISQDAESNGIEIDSNAKEETRAAAQWTLAHALCPSSDIPPSASLKVELVVPRCEGASSSNLPFVVADVRDTNRRADETSVTDIRPSMGDNSNREPDRSCNVTMASCCLFAPLDKSRNSSRHLEMETSANEEFMRKRDRDATSNYNASVDLYNAWDVASDMAHSMQNIDARGACRNQGKQTFYGPINVGRMAAERKHIEDGVAEPTLPTQPLPKPSGSRCHSDISTEADSTMPESSTKNTFATHLQDHSSYPFSLTDLAKTQPLAAALGFRGNSDTSTEADSEAPRSSSENTSAPYVQDHTSYPSSLCDFGEDALEKLDVIFLAAIQSFETTRLTESRKGESVEFDKPSWDTLRSPQLRLRQCLEQSRGGPRSDPERILEERRKQLLDVDVGNSPNPTNRSRPSLGTQRKVLTEYLRRSANPVSPSHGMAVNSTRSDNAPPNATEKQIVSSSLPQEETSTFDDKQILPSSPLRQSRTVLPSFSSDAGHRCRLQRGATSTGSVRSTEASLQIGRDLQAHCTKLPPNPLHHGEEAHSTDVRSFERTIAKTLQDNQRIQVRLERLLFEMEDGEQRQAILSSIEEIRAQQRQLVAQIVPARFAKS